MKYHSKISAEEIRERNLHLIEGIYFNTKEGDKAKLFDITVDPAWPIIVNKRKEDGYFCIFRFESGPAINAAEFARMNGLPEVGGLFPAYR